MNILKSMISTIFFNGRDIGAAKRIRDMRKRNPNLFARNTALTVVGAAAATAAYGMHGKSESEPGFLEAGFLDEDDSLIDEVDAGAGSLNDGSESEKFKFNPEDALININPANGLMESSQDSGVDMAGNAMGLDDSMSMDMETMGGMDSFESIGGMDSFDSFGSNSFGSDWD